MCRKKRHISNMWLEHLNPTERQCKRTSKIVRIEKKRCWKESTLSKMLFITYISPSYNAHDGLRHLLKRIFKKFKRTYIWVQKNLIHTRYEVKLCARDTRSHPRNKTNQHTRTMEKIWHLHLVSLLIQHSNSFSLEMQAPDYA